MSFTVVEHVIPAQTIRELPNALAIDETSSGATLRLHVKQYAPKNNFVPRPGDPTIITFHSNGFCKEIYEPLWDQLAKSLPVDKRIRGIWSADVAHQGSSYLLNETKLGNGFAWIDHARDILHMVNHFREQIKPPILAVGHSMGAVMLLHLTNLHPRLFHSVALLDPWLYTPDDLPPIDPAIMLKATLQRKDYFPDPEKARQTMAVNPVFKHWHPDTLKIHFNHVFRELPTLLHPDKDTEINDGESSPQIPVTLRTPKQMEAYTLYKPNIDGLNTHPDSSRIERLAMTDLHYDSVLKAPVTNPATRAAATHLESLRPRCLFLYGAKSPLMAGRTGEECQKRNLEITGTGSGGSGGAALDCVQQEMMPGGHLFPFERPMEVGDRLAQWVAQEMDIWKREKVELEKVLWRGRMTTKDRQELDPRFVKLAKTWDGKDKSDEVAKSKL